MRLSAALSSALLPLLARAAFIDPALDTPHSDTPSTTPDRSASQSPPLLDRRQTQPSTEPAPAPAPAPAPIVIEGYGTTLSSYVVTRNTQCKNCPYNSCLNSGYMSTGSNLTFDCWLHGEPSSSFSPSSSSSTPSDQAQPQTNTWLKFTYGQTLDEYCFVPAADLAPLPYYIPATTTAQQKQIPFCGSRLEADLYLPSVPTTTTGYTECSLCPYRDCPGVEFYQAHTLLQVDCMTREGWQQFAPDSPNGTATYYRVAVGGAPGGVSAGLGPATMSDGTAPTVPGSSSAAQSGSQDASGGAVEQQRRQPCYVSLATVQELQGKPYILAIGGGGQVTDVSIQDPLPPCGPVPILAFGDGDGDGDGVAGASETSVVSDQAAAGEFTAAAVGDDLGLPLEAVSSVLPPSVDSAAPAVGAGAGAMGASALPFTHFANAPSLFPPR